MVQGFYAQTGITPFLAAMALAFAEEVHYIRFMNATKLRPDLTVIASLIAPGSLVLDIGCGCGELLQHLAEHKQVEGRGIDLNQQKVGQAIARGLSVIQGDADEDLAYYPDKAYDYVISSQTLQAMKHPKEVLTQMVRVGKYAIVSVPNFGHWRNRLYLGLKGKMPMSETLSYPWYETPNIHFCTLADFIALCEEMRLTIEERHGVGGEGGSWKFRGHSIYANLMAEEGVFLLQG